MKIKNYIPGCSERVFDVFQFDRHVSNNVKTQVGVESELFRFDEISTKYWKVVSRLNGIVSTIYLRLRYGSPETHLYFGSVNGNIVHVEWIVPSKKIKSRYPFVRDGSFFIISCVTESAFRGKRIYPNQICKVVGSEIKTDVYWIAAAQSNIASLKGIKRAGGRKAGEYVFMVIT